MGAAGTTCPSCGATADTGARFCADCGARLSAALGREGRKVVTALFADIVGSTALSERMDPEDFDLVIGEAIARMTAVAADYGGEVHELRGDGLLALYGAAVTHEDDPERAVLSALRMLTSMSAYADELERDHLLEGFAVRIGVDTGLVVVGQLRTGQKADFGAMGDALNTAARLQNEARPGAALVSAATQRLIASQFTWGERREFTLKGKGAPVAAYEATGIVRDAPPTRRSGHAEAPLVGRERELAAAHTALDAALRGRGGMLMISGEPGIGKTRLIAELRAAAAASDSSPLWLEGRSVSYGHATPYLPFQSLFRDWFARVRPDQAPEVALRDTLGQLMPARAAELNTVLGSMLDLTTAPAATVPESIAGLRQERGFEAVSALIERLAQDACVIVVVDDVQWADRSSLALLERLVELSREAALLIVVGVRTGEEPEGPAHLSEVAATELGERFRELPLAALSADDGARILGALAGAGVIREELVRPLLDRAGGNPLYLEELIRSLLDDGIDEQRLLEVPETVEQVVVARIDRLPAACHDVLSAASVIGRDFTRPVLQSVLRADDLDESLSELRRIDLIRGDGEVGYSFRHPLVQEATYRRLLKRRRRELHRLTAIGIERCWTGSAGEEPNEQLGLLAEHYALAGDAEPAYRYSVMAARAAVRAHALSEAVAHYDRALALAEQVENVSDSEIARRLLARGALRGAHDIRASIADTELALVHARAAGDRIVEVAALVDLGQSVRGSDFVRAVSLHEQALSLARETSDEATVVGALARLSQTYSNQLRFDRAVELGDEALARAERTGDQRLLLRAIDALKLAALQLGDIDRLDRLTRRLTDVLGDSNLSGEESGLAVGFDDAPGYTLAEEFRAYALMESAYVPLARCDFDEAAARAERGMAGFLRVAALPTAVLFLDCRGWIDRVRGDYERALALGEQAVEVACRYTFEEFRGWSTAGLAMTLLELGAPERAIPHLEDGRAVSDSASARNLVARCTSLLARARWLVGERNAAISLAFAAADQLSEVTAPSGMTFLFGTHAYVAVASVLRASGHPHQAEQLLRPVVSAASPSGWSEALAQSSVELGRCLADLGDAAAGRALAEHGLELASSGGMPGRELDAHCALAVILSTLGEDTAAVEHAAEAAAIADGIAAQLSDPKLRESVRSQVTEGLLEQSRTG